MTTTAEPQALPDAGPCRWCADVQWDHKRGKGGCKVPGCGCDKYAPPKELPALPVVEDASVPEAYAVAGDFRQLTDPVETLDVEPRRRREPAGEPAVTDPAAQAEHADQVAAIDEQLAQPEPSDDEIANEIDRAEDAAVIERLTGDRDRLSEQLMARLRDLDEAQARIGVLERDLRFVAAERNGALTEVGNLRRALVEHEEHNARERGARSAELAQVRAELNRATIARQRAQDQLGQAVQTGLAAAMRVLWRYDADQCETCGFRTTVPGMNHAHPLKPVTVLVVERDQADDTTKEPQP